VRQSFAKELAVPPFQKRIRKKSMHGRHRKLKDRLNKTPARVYDDGLIVPWPFAKTDPSGLHEALKNIAIAEKGVCIFAGRKSGEFNAREQRGDPTTITKTI
jgi:hypothetical protein